MLRRRNDENFVIKCGKQPRLFSINVWNKSVEGMLGKKLKEKSITFFNNDE